ncbi:peptidyl-prolyl cis-trans isomerase [Deinococcus sp. KNUC1210]|uniref:peptidylprolyl isomerase n=1 Tax=Deinococcus sp. KNUC1210 TaxID=2917691 RepID=UPI001EEF8718|nr:peptidylprolyl isomerase [Deinococcus sp. KNUC1210]ULH16294.1 peptidyl-prolyl cis-trans isomerase [Deinococcus sp. KNUC1210]
MNRTVAIRVLLGLFAVLLIVALVFNFLPALSNLNSSASSGTPALKVNGETVTSQELDKIRTQNPVLGSASTGVLGDDFKTLIVDQQVLQVLLRQAAKDEKVDRSVVNDQVTQIRKQNNLTDNAAWTNALKSQGYGSDSAFREYVRSQLAIQAKAKAIQSAAPKPTDAQLKLYYTLNSASLLNDPKIVARAIVVADKTKADALLKQAQGGADFAQLATANSLENKDRGGALGPVENGAPRPVAQVALPTEVGTAAFAKTTGGLTDVVASGGKFYIVKVEKYIAAAPKTFEEAKSTITDAVTTQLKNQAIESWLDSLKQNVKIETVDPTWKFSNPTVAVVNGQNVPYAEAVSNMIANQQFSALLQQAPADQAAPLVNSFLKPTIVQQLIQQYAAPIIVKNQKIALAGTRAELLAGLNAYGARDVKVSDADVLAFYNSNQAQFKNPAKATVSEAVFKDKQQALAFRQDFKSGDFTAAASKAGATVSERGAVTEGDQKLNTALDKAVFATTRLQSAGEGSLSDVVENGGKFSLAYVTDLVKSSVKPLASVQDTIRTQLLAQKKSAAGTAFVTTQLKTIKTQDLLSKVLADQTKRVAVVKPTTPGSTPATTAPTTTPSTPANK